MALARVEADGEMMWALELDGGELVRLMRVSQKAIGPVSDYAKQSAKAIAGHLGDAPPEFIEFSIRVAGTLVMAEMVRQLPGHIEDVREKENKWIREMDHEVFALYAGPNLMIAIATGELDGLNEEEIERVLLASMLLNPEMIVQVMQNVATHMSATGTDPKSKFHLN